MGLRKQPPPRLQNISKPNARLPARSPTSVSTSSPSSSRQTHLKRLPSEDSIYSPDLNTSPAFDLMPLEEAQRSPVGSPTTHPPNSWPDDMGTPDHGSNPGYSAPPVPIRSQYTGASENVWQSNHDTTEGSMGEVPVQLQSNNPFLKPRSAEHTQDLLDRNEWGRTSQATTNSEALSHTDGYIPMTARLSLIDQPEQESPWGEPAQSHPDHRAVLGGQQLDDNSPWGYQQSNNVADPQELHLGDPHSNPYTPPVVVEPNGSYNGPEHTHAQYHQSINTDRLGSDAGIDTPSVAPSNATSATSHQLIDFDGSGATSNLGIDNGSRAGSSVYSESATKEATPLSDAQSPNPPSSTVQPHNNFSGHGHQPHRELSAEEAARQKEQRSETYTIRHVRWTDKSGELRESPVLVQNENGPCPLLALINALVLRADPKVQPPIVRALSTREQISLGLLIEAMFEELITCLSPDEEFPDIEALAQFLTMLHTGMNVNPRLTLESTDGLGSFFETSDLRLYSTFGIPLIHAWLASWSSSTHAAMSRTGQYYEDIQMLPFRRQELEDRATRGEQPLTFEEESTMEDIQTIQQFVEIENATQLSPFGLTQLSTRLAPGSVSILFRNDHFSTLYKHPQSHQLYTLVTDEGYAGHAEVVWESLVDVTGFNTEYHSGDFRPVGAGPSAEPASPSPAGPRTSSIPANPPPNSNDNEPPQSPEPTQEQSDADFAYALSLQFEEEQREHARAQDGEERRTSSNDPSNRPVPPPRMNNPPNRVSNLTTGLRNQPGPTPHHDADPDDPNAPPPPYEQAAGGPRYSPPNRRPAGPSQGNQYPGRGSRGNHSQYSSHRPRPSVSTNSDRMSRDRNKDCVVM